MKLTVIAFRNIRRNRRRSLLSGSAIALATMFITLMFSVLAGMMNDYRANVVRYVTGHVRIRNAEYDRNEELNPLHLSISGYQEVAARLEREEGVRVAAPRIRLHTALYRDEEVHGGVGLGLDFARERELMRVEESLEQGRIPAAGRQEMLLSAGLAEELGVMVGDRLTLLAKNKYLGLSGMTFAVTGIVRFPVAVFNDSFFLLPIDTAGRFLKMSGEATELLVLLDDPGQAEGFAARADALLQEMGRTSARARPWTGIGRLYSFVQLAGTAYDFIALVFFILGSTVIVSTTMMVIYERMREIGTVAAMGMTPGEIVRLFFLEALFIAVMAAAAGSLAGIAITIPLTRTGVDLSGPMQGMSFEVSSVLHPQLNLRSTLFVFLFSVAISSLASFIPSRRAARIEPVDALRAV
jgi:putative ABC transport system permease protein